MPLSIEFDLELIRIKCPHCWSPVAIFALDIPMLETMEKLDLLCCKNVPVKGKDGILERVRRARGQKA